MSEKFIPIFKADAAKKINAISAAHELSDGPLLDRLHRPITDLRISVTDRCNFRCTYCMPKEIFDREFSYLPQSALLNFEEIVAVARAFVALGVKKIRLTGGEPLLRKHIDRLIEQLSQLRQANGETVELAMTTNGALLTQFASRLKAAGLHRLTVSLDAIDDVVFRQMNDVDFPVADVLRGIEEAQRIGFEKIKINMVVKAGTNDDQIVPMARYFKQTPHTLRFIEYMDVGDTNAWRLDQVVASETIRQRLQNAGLALRPLPQHQSHDTASRWSYQDSSSAEIGFISSVSQAFCRDCSRIRLSTEGQLYTCLFASHGHDLRPVLRGQNVPPEITTNPELQHRLMAAITQVWRQRDDRYSEQRLNALGELGHPRKKIEMSYIGG